MLLLRDVREGKRTNSSSSPATLACHTKQQVQNRRMGGGPGGLLFPPLLFEKEPQEQSLLGTNE